MSATTKIEWCDSTWNPWIGCTRVSPACDDCYAARSTPARTMGIVWGPGEARHRTSDDNWKEPRRWNDAHAAFFAQHGRRRRVFCASLADVFDNAVPVNWRVDLWAVIESTPNLDWLLLTKRIGNVRGMVPAGWLERGGWPAHVRLGATVANQAEADRDLPKLLDVPARTRFLSIEPLLGPITLPGFDACTAWCPICKAIVPDSFQTMHEDSHDISWMDRFDPARHCSSVYDMVQQVIVGGESGPHARPMHPNWARSLRDQCQESGVPFLFKQWGEYIHEIDDMSPLEPVLWASLDGRIGDEAAAVADGGAWQGMYRIGKAAAGRLLDGREWNGRAEDHAC